MLNNWIDWIKIHSLIEQIAHELDLDLMEITDVNIWSNGKKVGVDVYLPVKHKKYGWLDSKVTFSSEEEK